MMALSIVALVAVVLKALSPLSAALSKRSEWLNGAFFLAIVVLAGVNLSYLSTVVGEDCSSGSVSPSDVIANKNLGLFIGVLSVIALVLGLKRVASWGVGKRVSAAQSASMTA